MIFFVAGNPVLESHRLINKEILYQFIFKPKKRNNIFEIYYARIIEFKKQHNLYISIPFKLFIHKI